MEAQKLVMSKNEVIKQLDNLLYEMFHIKINDYDISFSEYGILSINVPPFARRLEEKFKVDIPVSTIFNYSNINLLSEYIYSLMHNEEDNLKTNFRTENNNTDEKIAIIGMSCHFPAGASTPEKYWDVLINGVDGIREVPKERWDKEKYYSEDESIPGKMYCFKGGFLDESIEEFDAGFFNISPKEASYLDPQQRMLLELTWEAFENAGINISKYSGSNVGMYLGISSTEYALSGIYSGDLTNIGPYSLTGGCISAICGRVSYLFGFEGPCFAVDTACSSSLTALHLACNALKAGETDMAVVSGVNLMLSPVISVAFSKLGAISKDGHTKAFDASADGYARAEGGGVLLIKKLSEAIKDKDNILGVISGTGINQDGVSNGLTAPNGASQEKLMRNTLNVANLSSLDVDYIEMHGTGTKLGDPIEVGAVSQVYAEGRMEHNPLLIGSVKSNIGHLEPASGIASIIKVLLALKNDMIPANLSFNTPNQFIDWGKNPIKVVNTSKVWKKDGIRRAGVNGFGFGGSNAHVIIEEYKNIYTGNEEAYNQKENYDTNYILKITAKTEKSQRDYAFKYVKFIEQCSDKELVDMLYSANRGRTDFNYRMALIGNSREELLNKLKSSLIGSSLSGVYCNYTDNLDYKKGRKVIFMFTGQGSQYINMGRELYNTNQTFRECVDLCDKKFRPYILESLINLIYSEKADNNLIQRTVYAQPLIFTIGYALANMWASYGITPDVVLGHSIGEYVAATVSGILNINDAVKLVALRGRLMEVAPGQGTMATILADENLVEELIAKYQPKVSIATINAKESYVISGEYSAVEEILKLAEDRGIQYKRLKVSHAFHSEMMVPILEDFKTIASEVTYNTPKIRFVSTMYAREIQYDEILDAGYWTNHIRQKVDFYHAITSIEDSREYIYFELGAHSVLTALCKLIYGNERIIVSSLNMKEKDSVQVAGTLAKLYVAGINVNWDRIEFDGKKAWNRMNVPNYPYDKSKYWLNLHYDNRENASASKIIHPLLGEKFESPLMGKGIVFQRRFTAEDPNFMKEHVIFDTAISPAAAHISFILSAIKELRNPVSCTVKAIEFRTPLAVYEDETRIVQFCFQETEKDTFTFSIVSKDENPDSEDQDWQLHASGVVAANMNYREASRKTDFSELTTWELDPVQPEQGTYALMTNSGFKLGDGFRRMLKTAHNSKVEGEYVSQIIPYENIPDKDNYIIYPGTIDSVFQMGTLLEVTKRIKKNNGVIEDAIYETIIPYFMEEFTYNYVEVGEIQAYVNIRSKDNNFIHLDIEAFNEKGDLVISFKDLMARIIMNRESLLQSNKNNLSKFYYQQSWYETDGQLEIAQPTDREYFVVVSDTIATVQSIADKLSNYGFNVICLICSRQEIKSDNHLYCANLDNPERYEWVLKEITSKYKNKLKFIFCYGLEDEYHISNGNMSNIHIDSIRELYHLTKAITNNAICKNATLKILTKNAQNVLEANGTNLSQATIWGFAKVLGLEYPNVFEGVIDIDNVTGSEGNIVTELITKSNDEVCLRGDKRYIARINRLNKRSNLEKHAAKLPVKGDATYVITGGTGALGLIYAHCLVDLGAKYLILICRNKPKEEVVHQIEMLRRKEIIVEVVHLDICDEVMVKKEFDVINTKYPVIRGVIHAAGILADKLIEDLTWDSFEKVMSPKLQGSINIYNSLDKEALDFIILLSSISSLLGNVSQSNYAAANYFMNRFSEELQNKGYPVYTMCWGPWNTGGMASDNKAIELNMNSMGLKAFSNNIGEEIIKQFFNKPINNLMIVDIDWEVLVKNISSESQKRYISELLNSSGNIYTEKTEVDNHSVLKQLKSLQDKTERTEYLLLELQKICSKIMGFRKGDLLDTTVALREQGADSLMMFSMRTTLNKCLETNIEVSTFFNYPTLAELADYLVEYLVSEYDSQKGMNIEVEEDDNILQELESVLN